MGSTSNTLCNLFKESPCDPGMAIATFDWLDVARNSSVNALLMPYIMEQNGGSVKKQRTKRIKGNSSSDKGKEEEDDDDNDEEDFFNESSGGDDEYYEKVPKHAVKKPTGDRDKQRKKLKVSSSMRKK
jgi:hypothetical protein